MLEHILSSKGNILRGKSQCIVFFYRFHRYSTDYGRHWHEKTFSNETSVRILSLLADNNNVFYLLTSTPADSVELIELNLNHLIGEL
jgi:hypothetical protein